MVGLSDDKLNYEKYIIFQRPFNLDKDDDPRTAANGIYIECNGDSCFNCCSTISLEINKLFLVVQDTEIEVDLSEVKVPKKFTRYLKEIFNEILEIKT